MQRWEPTFSLDWTVSAGSVALIGTVVCPLYDSVKVPP